MSQVVTPAQVEQRLIQLSRELDEAHKESVNAEFSYYEAKGNFEVNVAAARLRVGSKYAEKGLKATVQDREDEATMATKNELATLYQSEAVVKAARANVNRLRSQIDITRSIAANVRNSMEVV
jgi:hypothetical protein